MNEKLRALYEEDISDARTFRGEEAFLASQARRVLVGAIVESEGLHSAEDYFHATLVYQHGERLEHWAQAYLLARTAADLGHPRAGYMVAAAHDRWLMRQGKPQKYGTNSLFDGTRTRIWDYDPSTTDAERAALDVPPLAELVERAELLNDLPPQHPQIITTVQAEGLRIEIFDLGNAGPPAGMPIYAIPAYEALRDGVDPRPRYLPPDLRLWRFGKLLCAKNSDGQIVCTWHPCGWRIAGGPATATAEQLFAALGGVPQWMSDEKATWARLALPSSPQTCWIVGGLLAREELARIALSLP